MRFHVSVLVACVWWMSSIAAAGDVGLQAHWLWSSRFPRSQETIRLRREFLLPVAAQSAELRGLADDHAAVLLDGQRIGELTSARRFTNAKVSSLSAGKHVLEIEATNKAGAAGVWLQLDWTDEAGRVQRLVTDGDWELIGSTGERRRATSLGLLGIAPWWRPAGELDDYDQWKRAIGTGQADEAARVRVVPGFQVELVRSSQKGEGSWVSVIFDAKGRAIIGREGPGILRMTLPTDSAEMHVELINDTLQECRGLLWAFDSLYANANNSKGLYRLRDTDGDDKFDEVKLLKTTGGGVGHGRNGLALGPDNLIYVIHGNNVLISETDRTIPDGSPLRNIAEDRLRPAYWDRFMFDSDAKVPAGYVARTDADGSMWQVVAGGFRNPYGIDFNAHGEMFTFDADNEGDQGTPWYRPTRINHIVSGGDYGFRQGSANRPGHYSEHLPSILNMGLASPTGVKSGHRGRFPPPYDKALFVCDWSYGRIHAIHLDPDGASYRCRSEVFLEGQPLNVTDVTFGPDGAMYFVTGGRGTQSGLYRVKERSDEPMSQHEALRPRDEAEAESRRTRRRSLERQQSATGRDLDSLISQLHAQDVWIRHAARVALERQPLESWQDQLLERGSLLSVETRITGLLALVRSAESSNRNAEIQRLVCERVNALPWIQLLWAEDRMDAWRVYEVAFARLGQPTNELAKAVTEVLALQYPQELEEPNQRLCELLAYLEWPPLVEKTIPRLEQAVEQEDKLAYLTILRNVPVGWTLELRRRYFAELRKADLFDGGNLLPIAVNGIREDALAMLSADERHELGSVLEPAAESGGDIATVTAQRPVVREWKLEDLETAVKNNRAPRDVARGEKLFRETLCVRCHRFGTEGRTIGPDLTFVASRFGPRDLLEHILVPSKVIDGKYRQTVVETKSGQVLSGRVVGGDAENLLLAPDPLRPTKVMKIPLNDIDARKASPVSPMPAGMLNSLTEPEILDLLEYLRIGRR
jgi:putative heme-binding domain-containing protein